MTATTIRAAPAISQPRSSLYGNDFGPIARLDECSRSKLGAAVVKARAEPQPGQRGAWAGTSVWQTSQVTVRLALDPSLEAGRRRVGGSEFADATRGSA